MHCESIHNSVDNIKFYGLLELKMFDVVNFLVGGWVNYECVPFSVIAFINLGQHRVLVPLSGRLLAYVADL